ncbi:MAG: anaerobic ribonucleoside-triphosphate reductase activating protein [Candidatus Pacearchaeota archaeon]|nr:anaerobic ribonucleoside-triphosphate reductase activating protein [Candidatus Pacearchaeota archaeon]
MIIASLQKQSLIEYPGKISSVIFLAGCNLRCGFCYVPDLVVEEKIRKIRPIKEEEVLSFLKKRKKFLDAVVITGGEPTINKELPTFIEKIKKIGYCVGIETNGTVPSMLSKLINKQLVDYVALDIKHDLIFKKYNEICGGLLTKKMFSNVAKSIRMLLNGDIAYEFRTTLVKEFHTKKDILNVCKKIRKARVYYLQNYKENENVAKKKFTPFSEEEIEEIIKEGKKWCNILQRKYF